MVASTAGETKTGTTTKLPSTAEMCAVIRAVESMRPAGKRILDDQFARHFIQSRQYATLFKLRSVALTAARFYNKFFTGWAAEIILRYRHFDEWLQREVAGGCTQLVILGAGYDSTALRCQFSADLTIYELDLPAMQRKKLDVMRRKSLRPHHRVSYVGCDFGDSGDFARQLLARGFDPHKPCLVGWLGVPYYLPETAVRATLAQLAELCAPDSKVMLDYLVPGVIDRTIDHVGARRGARFAAMRGEPFRFGIDRDAVDCWLAGSGFGVAENLLVPDLIERYARPEDFWLTVADFIGVLTLERTGPAPGTSGGDRS